VNLETKLLILLPILALVSFEAFQAYGDAQTIVEGDAGQTVQLLLLNNSAGTTQFEVTIDGDVYAVGDFTFDSDTAFTLSLVHTLTGDETITFPDSTDTVVLVGEIQTLTGKTLVCNGVTNTCTINLGEIADVNTTACVAGSVDIIKLQANGTFICTADDDSGGSSGDSISEGDSFVSVNDTASTTHVGIDLDGSIQYNFTGAFVDFLDNEIYNATINITQSVGGNILPHLVPAEWYVYSTCNTASCQAPIQAWHAYETDTGIVTEFANFKLAIEHAMANTQGSRTIISNGQVALDASTGGINFTTNVFWDHRGIINCDGILECITMGNSTVGSDGKPNYASLTVSKIDGDDTDNSTALVINKMIRTRVNIGEIRDFETGIHWRTNGETDFNNGGNIVYQYLLP